MVKMLNMLKKARTRIYLYVVSLAVIGILVFYGVMEANAIPVWVTLITALLGFAPAVALKNITPDKEADE
jgi:multisubunit Na+/H+ antiporter MnhF subunit